jgi:hypothetical protein
MTKREGGWGAAPHLAWSIVALVALAQMALPARAEAARGLITGLYADQYTSEEDSVRRQWFDTTVHANASVVRVNVSWNVTVGSQQPADPRNPTDPAYNFAPLDGAVREAAERGLEVFLTVYEAPPWAEGPNRPDDPVDAGQGAWKPDPGALGDFATALATRYSGSFPDPAGIGPLPRVRYYEAWNEPNIPQYLAPQYEGGKPSGVTIYRNMLRSVSSAVKAVNTSNLVIGPGLAPYGDPPSHDWRARPFHFLRNLLCLKGGKKPEAEQRCPRKQVPTLDIFSAHPINSYGGPADEAAPGDAASGDLDELERALRVAEKAKNIRPRGRRPLWVTEFWWATSEIAGSPLVVDLPTQARYVAQSLYLHWKAGAQVSTYFGLAGGPLGLFFSDGTPKPAFDAFRFPFVAERQRKGRVLVWGKAPASGQVDIQRQVPDGFETVKQLSVQGGSVFTTRLRISGPATLRGVIGSDASLPWQLAG